jgi:hypothetical protein
VQFSGAKAETIIEILNYPSRRGGVGILLGHFKKTSKTHFVKPLQLL